MHDAKKKVKTQWGHYVRPFSSFSEQEVHNLMAFCSETAKLAELITGKECFLVYGALLGYERTGTLISHDFDIDMTLFCGDATRDEVADVCANLMRGFLDRGYEIKAKTYGQFFVYPPSDVHRCYKLEIFASWIEDGNYYLYFAIPGKNLTDSVFPLKNIKLGDSTFKAPKDAAQLLAATYGDDWAIPNPNFKYEMDGRRWAPFTTYFFSRNRSSWENYYAENVKNGKSIARPKLNLNKFNRKIKILELGAGRCEDAVFNCKNGHEVLATDYLPKLIQSAQDQHTNINGLAFKVLNLYDVPQLENFSRENQEKFDLVYCCNVIEHISPIGLKNLFLLASGVIGKDGELQIITGCSTLTTETGDALCSSNATEGTSNLYRRRITDKEITEIAHLVYMNVEVTDKFSNGNTLITASKTFTDDSRQEKIALEHRRPCLAEIKS